MDRIAYTEPFEEFERWYAEARRNPLWGEGDDAGRRGQLRVSSQQGRSWCRRQFDVECVDQPLSVNFSSSCDTEKILSGLPAWLKMSDDTHQA